MKTDSAKYDPIPAHQVLWMRQHGVAIVDRIDWPSGIRHVKVTHEGKEFANNGRDVNEALDRLFRDIGIGGLSYGLWCLEHACWLLAETTKRRRAAGPPWVR